MKTSSRGSLSLKHTRLRKNGQMPDRGDKNIRCNCSCSHLKGGISWLPMSWAPVPSNMLTFGWSISIGSKDVQHTTITWRWNLKLGELLSWRSLSQTSRMSPKNLLVDSSSLCRFCLPLSGGSLLEEISWKAPPTLVPTKRPTANMVFGTQPNVFQFPGNPPSTWDCLWCIFVWVIFVLGLKKLTQVKHPVRSLGSHQVWPKTSLAQLKLEKFIKPTVDLAQGLSLHDRPSDVHLRWYVPSFLKSINFAKKKTWKLARELITTVAHLKKYEWTR